jgi:hypothetical protein
MVRGSVEHHRVTGLDKGLCSTVGISHRRTVASIWATPAGCRIRVVVATADRIDLEVGLRTAQHLGVARSGASSTMKVLQR